MQIVFESYPFAICIRTSKTYSIADKGFLSPAVNMRIGRLFTWSTGRGLRKFGVD